MSLQPLTPEQAHRRLQAGAILVDIREQDEYAREHIERARNHPLSALAGVAPIHDRPVIFHCRSGQRTLANATRLEAIAAEGFILDGGIDAWKDAGFPVAKDRRQPLEMMRQVQIAAGALILLGVGLGVFLSPAFYALSGFVGAGLMFAGVTGTCGMARLLALAPWNRRAPASATALAQENSTLHRSPGGRGHRRWDPDQPNASTADASGSRRSCASPLRPNSLQGCRSFPERRIVSQSSRTAPGKPARLGQIRTRLPKDEPDPNPSNRRRTAQRRRL
jgi:rhodanese-related sulfurtransferase